MELREVFESFCRYRCKNEVCVNRGTCVVEQFIEEVESLELLKERNKEHVLKG